MKKILIIGTNKTALQCIEVISSMTNMKIIAVIQVNQDKQAETFATSLHIPITEKGTLTSWLSKDVDYIIETTGCEKLTDTVYKNKSNFATLITAITLQSIAPFISGFRQHLGNFELLVNSIGDGLIVINAEENIQLMNQTASEIIGVNQQDVIGKPILDIVHNSRLPNTLRHHRKEVNRKLLLENGKEVIATSAPLINEKNHLLGAFSVFKDRHEVLSLAEENTDLKEIKTMLEAIIHSSDEAISVVDESGNGLIINPAYTRITGLTEQEVIGEPATVDISEGESTHLQVLETRRPVRRARMKVGPSKKDVLVNVAPIIVAGKLKGSVAVIHDISEIELLTKELKKARQMIRNLEASYTFADIIGKSSEMTIAVEQAKIGAKTPATVLLRGASGTGKELFAHAIHNESDRKYNKFIRVNCAAIAEGVLESELFGYEDGAFTGAKTGGKKGLFEEANKGSIFLDEISELSLPTQAKLLRVLQEKEVVRVGGTMPISIDVRIIAATNANLEKAITKKTFREDLYYRLNRLPIYIPSLQERLSDLPGLVQYMITKVNQLYGRNVTSISKSGLGKLRRYHWPGNIRELENVIGRAVIFMDVKDDIIDVRHLPKFISQIDQHEATNKPTIETNYTLQQAMDKYECQFIQEVYKSNQKNKTETATQLKISLRSLYYKLNKYNIS